MTPAHCSRASRCRAPKSKSALSWWRLRVCVFVAPRLGTRTCARVPFSSHADAFFSSRHTSSATRLRSVLTPIPPGPVDSVDALSGFDFANVQTSPLSVVEPARLVVAIRRLEIPTQQYRLPFGAARACTVRTPSGFSRRYQHQHQFVHVVLPLFAHVVTHISHSCRRCKRAPCHMLGGSGGTVGRRPNGVARGGVDRKWRGCTLDFRVRFVYALRAGRGASLTFGRRRRRRRRVFRRTAPLPSHIS